MTESTHDPIRWWAHHTSPGLAAAVGPATVAVLPTAAIEQHGPHLPLSTDLDIGLGLLRAAFRVLSEETSVLALPPLAVGASEEHAGLPGTLSAPDMTGSIVAVGRAVAAAGVRRLVVANSHGGNRAAVDTAALALRNDPGLLVVKAHWFRFPRPEGAGLPEPEWVHGLHGGAVETAMMLHLHPERVRTEGLRDFRSLGRDLEETLRHVGPEAVAPFAWRADDLHPDGVAGDATLATAALGERLVTHYGRVLAEILEDAAAFPLERLAGGNG